MSQVHRLGVRWNIRHDVNENAEHHDHPGMRTAAWAVVVAIEWHIDSEPAVKGLAAGRANGVLLVNRDRA
jgi:hypothetical protein